MLENHWWNFFSLFFEKSLTFVIKVSYKEHKI